MSVMGEYWLNFARTGNPNGCNIPVWPQFTKDNHQSMYLVAPTPQAIPVPDEKSLEVLDSYFTWRRTAEGRAFGTAE